MHPLFLQKDGRHHRCGGTRSHYCSIWETLLRARSNKKIYARYQLRGSETLLIPYCVKMISSYSDPKEAKDGVIAQPRKWLKIRIKGQHLNALSLYLSIQNSHEGMLNHTRFHKQLELNIWISISPYAQLIQTLKFQHTCSLYCFTEKRKWEKYNPKWLKSTY